MRPALRSVLVVAGLAAVTFGVLWSLVRAYPPDYMRTNFSPVDDPYPRRGMDAVATCAILVGVALVVAGGCAAEPWQRAVGRRRPTTNTTTEVPPSPTVRQPPPEPPQQ